MIWESSNQYFYRTHSQSEVDLVEEREGQLFGYEVKWKTKGHKKAPQPWAAYEKSNYTVIDKDHLKGFIW